MNHRFKILINQIDDFGKFIDQIFRNYWKVFLIVIYEACLILILWVKINNEK